MAATPRRAGARSLGAHARDRWFHRAQQRRSRRSQLLLSRSVPDPRGICIADARSASDPGQVSSSLLAPPFWALSHETDA